MENRVTVGIPTKDRQIEISLLLHSLLIQTYQNFDILIIDDCANDLMHSNSTIQYLIKLLKNSEHDVTILKGEIKGPHIAGQKILENAKTELILRLDDDILLRPTFIEELIKPFDDPNVGAVGPIYLNPHDNISKQVISKEIENDEIEFNRYGKIYWYGKELFLTGYLQSVLHFKHSIFSVEHLNSGFMYRKSAGLNIGGYCLELSPVGHREESDFSYRIFKEGYKLLVNSNAISFHGHPMQGGIRETNGVFLGKENWDHDEAIFLERIKKILPMNKNFINEISTSVIVLTYGKDHSNVINLLDSIYTYTNFPCEIIVVNNGNDSCFDLYERYSKKNIPFSIVTTGKDVSVSSARNMGVEHSKGKYLCFIDDDAIILGRYNQTTDWLDYLYNEFTRIIDTGAFGPIYTWFEELQSYVLSVACLFTSKKVWEIVGGFDPVFGNKEKQTWGYEDVDWSYRCVSLGFKIRGISDNNFPFYHEDTTYKLKTEEREKAILKAHDILLAKYDLNEINHVSRKRYPFFANQMDIRGIKLNIGCYYMYLDGFTNIDIQDNVGADLICDLRNIKSNFENNSVSLILISQCLEHVTPEDAFKALKDFYDILKPNGILIVEVPLVDNLQEKIDNGKIRPEDVNVLLHGSPSMPYQEHLATFEFLELLEMLNEIGFRNIVKISQEYTSDQWEALRIDCIK